VSGYFSSWGDPWKSGASAPRKTLPQGDAGLKKGPVFHTVFLIFDLQAENLACRNHRVAMDRHRVLHPPRVASGISHHDRDVTGSRHAKYQLVAFFSSIDR
jgi:hypothetical protein